MSSSKKRKVPKWLLISGACFLLIGTFFITREIERTKNNNLIHTERRSNIKKSLKTSLELKNDKLNFANDLQNTSTFLDDLVRTIKAEMRQDSGRLNWVSSKSSLSQHELDSIFRADSLSNKYVQNSFAQQLFRQNEVITGLSELIKKQDTLRQKLETEIVAADNRTAAAQRRYNALLRSSNQEREEFNSRFAAAQDELKKSRQAQNELKKELQDKDAEIEKKIQTTKDSLTIQYEKIKAEVYFLFETKGSKIPVLLDREGLDRKPFRQITDVRLKRLFQVKISFNLPRKNQIPEKFYVSIKESNRPQANSFLGQTELFRSDLEDGQFTIFLEQFEWAPPGPGKYTLYLQDEYDSNVLLLGYKNFYIQNAGN